jgi:hypothetical protein
LRGFCPDRALAAPTKSIDFHGCANVIYAGKFSIDRLPPDKRFPSETSLVRSKSMAFYFFSGWDWLSCLVGLKVVSAVWDTTGAFEGISSGFWELLESRMPLTDAALKVVPGDGVEKVLAAGASRHPLCGNTDPSSGRVFKAATSGKHR